MALKEDPFVHIRKFDDPILKEMCRDVDFKSDDIDDTVQVMRTISRHKDCAGLAAPQVGVPLRIIAVEGTIMINPALISESPTKTAEDEGCLSYPGVVGRNIERALSVEVEYNDYPGFKKRSETLTYFKARVFQHELDHLNGICLVGEQWAKTTEGHT